MKDGVLLLEDGDYYTEVSVGDNYISVFTHDGYEDFNSTSIHISDWEKLKEFVDKQLSK